MRATVPGSSRRRRASMRPTHRRGARLPGTGPSSVPGAASSGGCGCARSNAGPRVPALEGETAGVGDEQGRFGGCRQEEAMSGLRIFAIALIVLGILGLAYGQFSYTRKSHDADLGVVKLSIKEKETVDVPTWAGVAAIVAGAALLVVGRKR